jgi:ATPase family associated with various cellular activities (AAA)
MTLNEVKDHATGPLGFATLTAVLAGLAAGWARVKSFGSYVISALILQRTVHSFPLTSALIEHIRGNYKMMPSGKSAYMQLFLQIDDRPMCSVVPFEIPLGTGFWRGKQGTFLVSADAGSNISLTSLRWISNPNQLIADSLLQQEARKARDADSTSAGNYRVIPIMGSVGSSYQGFGEGHDSDSKSGNRVDSSPAADPNDMNGAWLDPNIRVDKSFMYEQSRYSRTAKQRDPLRGLFYPQHVLDILEDLKKWYKRRDWYQERGIPWRFGVMMVGPGGTGKSSMAKVAAQTLGVPLYQYYLNTLNDRDFVHKWNDMDAPCVVALEDFDTVFHGRESMTVHKSLSFECVLNQISGISSLNGVLLIVTTNHVEHIDPALGRIDENGRPTRPGRIDRIIHMGATTEDQRQRMADYTLGDIAPDMVASLVANNVDTTAAQFQSLCIQLALDRLSEPGLKSNVVPLLDRHGVPVHPELEDDVRMLRGLD